VAITDGGGPGARVRLWSCSSNWCTCSAVPKGAKHRDERVRTNGHPSPHVAEPVAGCLLNKWRFDSVVWCLGVL
jgi:hypothetical protein